MGRRHGVAIRAVGMMTAVGVGAKQTATSVRAGIARLTETSVHDRRFQPVVMGLLPEECLPPLEPAVAEIRGLTSRQMRMLRLGGAALREATAGAGSVAEIPMFLGLPDALPGRSNPAGERFLELLARQSGVEFARGRSKMFHDGRAAGLVALDAAIRALGSGEVARALVGGVDTYLDLYLLGTLDAEGRVLAEGVMDGFVPGEGACFLLLDGDPAAAGAAVARIESVAVGAEKGHRYATEPYRGDGLASTFQGLWAGGGSDLPPVRSVWAGLNGEYFGAKEWGVALLRSQGRFVDEFRLEHPVDCFGDAGAALGPLLVGLAAMGVAKNPAEEPAIAWCSSDRETRAAALVRRAG